MEHHRNESPASDEGSFEAELRRLVADAHADDEQVEGAWVVDGADGSEWEVLITGVARKE